MAGADQKLNKYCTLCREVCIVVRTSRTLSKYTKTTLQIDPSSISPSPDNARQKVLLKALLCFHREKKADFSSIFQQLCLHTKYGMDDVLTYGCVYRIRNLHFLSFKMTISQQISQSPNGTFSLV